MKTWMKTEGQQDKASMDACCLGDNLKTMTIMVYYCHTRPCGRVAVQVCTMVSTMATCVHTSLSYFPPSMLFHLFVPAAILL